MSPSTPQLTEEIKEDISEKRINEEILGQGN